MERAAKFSHEFSLPADSAGGRVAVDIGHSSHSSQSLKFLGDTIQLLFLQHHRQAGWAVMPVCQIHLRFPSACKKTRDWES